MRKIKFRVWNKYDKKITFPDYINNLGIAVWNSYTAPMYSNKIMQFIGIYDKNGKEIYEEDIIIEEDLIGIITYDSISGRYFARDAIYDVYHFIPRWDEIEIIGNTFENPELLLIEENNEP